MHATETVLGLYCITATGYTLYENRLKKRFKWGFWFIVVVYLFIDCIFTVCLFDLLLSR